MNIKYEVVQPTPKLPFKYYLHDENSQKIVTPHWHRSIELGYLTSNNYLEFKDNDITYHYQKGDIWVINSRDVHSSQLNDSKNLMQFCLIIDYDFLKQAYPNINQLTFSLHGRPTSIKQLVAYQELEKELRMMIQLLQDQRDDGSNLSLTGHIYLIMANLIQNFSHKSDSTQTQLNETLIDQALGTINTYYMGDLNSNNLAKQLNTSVTTLNQQFHQAVQMPIGKYITTVRLLNAQKELLNTTNNIDSIAMNCGFSSTKSFIRNFKQWKGTTPFHYRKKFN
ncbi:AraC family transcriptional regulator [Companilactobacillus nuruki]|uniref:HTH araC/xylS-type domain-containing protein n=1 Tax=Companilactobacillus nuruki TaxID=1993540 RepID=A0A2N7AR63_9LACO|nr:AraC family transcriptional regulator [Companilactobacillus nuruki]PMD67838.1 hypothetical protein CBP76_12110 [Companilactobacillus nuruki]